VSSRAEIRVPWLRLSLGGIALGVGARLVDFVFPKWIGNVAAVWFLAGFVAGRAARRGTGMMAGIVCLTIATVAYYLLRLAIDPLSLRYLVGVPVMWLVAGVGSGAVSGRLGELSYRHAHAWGVPAGVFAGEAGVVMMLRQRVPQALAELVCAGLCLWRARARWPKATALAAGTVPFVAWLGLLYRIVLR
jgi:hypothetical protein